MFKLIEKLEKLPVATAGLALGTAGLGGVLGNEIDSSLRLICAGIAGIFLILILVKKFAHAKQLWKDISHPVAGSFIPAFDMCLMVIADLLTNYSLILGQVIWYTAIILHLVFALSFFYHRFRDFDLNHMLPSWFVPPVGIVVACVTGSHMHAQELTHAIFYVGFALYAVMLPTMFYRLIFGERISEGQLPAFAIMGAPASLCLAGYLTAFAQPNPEIVGILLALSLMMTSLVYISMIRINHLRIKFMPIYASFTFPLAIGATAMMKYSNFVGRTTDSGQFWHTIGFIEMCVAIVAITWVLFRMVHFINKEFKTV